MGQVSVVLLLSLACLGVSLSSAGPLGSASNFLKALQSAKRESNHGNNRRSNEKRHAHQVNFGGGNDVLGALKRDSFAHLNNVENNVAKRAHEVEFRGDIDVIQRALGVKFGSKISAAKRAHGVHLGQVRRDNNVAKRAHEVEFRGENNFAKRAHEVEFGGDNNFARRAQLGSNNKVNKRAEQVKFGDDNNRETHSIKFRDAASKRDASGDFACQVDNPQAMLNYRSGTHLNVFSSIEVPCDGRIARWDYYAQNAGTFHASIWRKEGDRFELVGSNSITAASAGQGSFEVPYDDRITVTQGLVLGIFYSQHIKNRASGGVVPYDDMRNTGVVGGVETLSPVHNSPVFAETLSPGTVVEGEAAFESGDLLLRRPALSFFVASEEKIPLMTLGYEAVSGDEMDEWVHATYITDPSQSASKAGQLVGWNLYVQEVMPIALQVWRPKGENRYQMISETWVHPSGAGPMHVDLGLNCARCRKIQVKPGDTLGFYFPDKAVIPFTRYQPCQEYNAQRYYLAVDSSGGQRAEEGDAITFEVADLAWGACRKYSYSAEILLAEEPVVPTPSPTGGGGGEGGASGCGVPQISPLVELDSDVRIVGGIPALAHSWPWMVSLQSESGFHYCGGSLIDSQWVVTAAHCMPFSSSDKVVVGMHSRQHTSGVESHVLASDFKHSGYDSFTMDKDIALLKLNRPVDLKGEISPVCLPSQGERFGGNLPCYTTGWGHTESGGSSPPALMQVKVPIVDRATCNQADWYNGEVTANMVCAGYEQGGKDSCQGDSGGPLVCWVDGRWKLTGVVSWGYGCASAKKPGIYTNTANFVEWVQETMRNN